MEYVFKDVNEAFPVMWHRLWSDDLTIEEQSRNGPVRRSIFPVTTIFTQPRNRVLLHKERDANPFFHLFESIWMLAGRNDVAWLCKFNKRMIDYSDDGLTLNSSYGYRWTPVLAQTVEKLKKDKGSRRAYLPIFHPSDCFFNGKDIPCNTGIAFYVRNDHLDMTVFNRSNDMIWGAYGANVVHFSFLQEYVAGILGIPVGYYAQISSNFHIYTEFEITKRLIGKVDPMPPNPYGRTVHPSPYFILVHADSQWKWQVDAAAFMNTYTMEDTVGERSWGTPFFARIAAPMYAVWHAFVKEKNTEKAFRLAEEILATDWRLAAFQWMDNRLLAREANARTDKERTG